MKIDRTVYTIGNLYSLDKKMVKGTVLLPCRILFNDDRTPRVPTKEHAYGNSTDAAACVECFASTIGFVHIKSFSRLQEKIMKSGEIC